MINAKGVTHTAVVRGAAYKNDEISIKFFTGMGDEELFDLKHDVGKRWVCLWLNSNGFSDKEALKWWKEPEIMQVWNNQWRRMDHWLIVPILHKVMPGERDNVYRDMHYQVFDRKHPYYLFLEMAIARAISRIEKEVRHDH